MQPISNTDDLRVFRKSEVAERLAISEDTVDDHMRQIFRKLRCNDKVVAVLRAVQIGAISI